MAIMMWVVGITTAFHAGLLSLALAAGSRRLALRDDH